MVHTNTGGLHGSKILIHFCKLYMAGGKNSISTNTPKETTLSLTSDTLMT